MGFSKRYESALQSLLDSGEALVSWIPAGSTTNQLQHNPFLKTTETLADRYSLDAAKAVPVGGEGCLVGITDKRIICVNPGRNPRMFAEAPHPGSSMCWWDEKGMFGTLTRRYVFALSDGRWFYVETVFRSKQAAPYDEFLAAFGDGAEHTPLK